MSRKETGGPAFPREDYRADDSSGQIGMTLRDYFSAKALVGLLSDSNLQGTQAEFAEHAYRLADAML